MHPCRHPLSLATGRPSAALAAAALLALGASAHAGVTPLLMEMSAVSSSCILNCQVLANRAIDTDSPDPLYDSFGNFSVDTFIDLAANAFPVEASGSTTITGGNSFTVHQLVNRLTRPPETTGRYETTVTTHFAFQTGVEGGPLNVAYTAIYARPGIGATLNTGLGVSAPRQQQGMSVTPLDYYSLSGTKGGVWVLDLLPNTYYELDLSTSNVTAFSSGPYPYETDRIDVTYRVTMPAFAQAVPEPASVVLWVLGWAGLAAMRLRRGR